MVELKGICVVMVTPFQKDEQVDYGALRSNIDWYIEQGVHGVIPLGSTGEFVALEDDERKKVLEVTVKQVAGRVPVIAGTAAETTAKAIKFQQHAKDAGATASMILPSYYCKPLQHEMYEHYRAIAEAVDLPIMLYNNPWSSGVDMQLETVLKCAELDQVQYIKESTGDIKRLRDITLQGAGKITPFCGWDDMALESFMMGAAGWVCVAANVAPSICVAMYDAFKANDFSQAMVEYKKILPLCAMLEGAGKLVQTAKTAMSMIGVAGGAFRKPRLPLDTAEEARLTAILRDMGLLSAVTA